MPPYDEVTLRGMRFHALVGVLPHEAEYAQPLEVDVTASVERDRGAADVLDYRLLYEAAAGEVAAGPIGYIERLAEQIAARTLALGGVRRADVTVRKPHVALPGPLACAEVRVSRSR